MQKISQLNLCQLDSIILPQKFVLLGLRVSIIGILYMPKYLLVIKLFTLPVIHQWRCLSHVILMLLDRNVSNYWHSWRPHNWTKPVTSGSCANTRAVTCAHSVTIFNQIQIFVLVPLWRWLLVIIHFIQIFVFPEIWKKKSLWIDTLIDPYSPFYHFHCL